MSTITSKIEVKTTPNLVTKVYEKLQNMISTFRKATHRPHNMIEIDLSNLEPYIVGPHTPDLARPISKMREDIKKNDYLDTISVALIGSCTNSSYEDMSRAADVAKQAIEKGIMTKVPLQVTPGSEMMSYN